MRIWRELFLQSENFGKIRKLEDFLVKSRGGSGMEPYLHFKKICDVIFALMLIIITLPIILLCVLLIKIEDPNGPIFFKQNRIGKNNKVFIIYKFRSMSTIQEKNRVKLSDNERLLKIGKIMRKLSIDEIPQTINILKGEMSFIGPRPLPPIYLPYYSDIEITRHNLSPGISGLAQVNGRNNISWDERLNYDVTYVSNISFYYDFKIFLKTITKVFLQSDVGVRGVDFKDESLHQIRSINKNYKPNGNRR